MSLLCVRKQCGGNMTEPAISKEDQLLGRFVMGWILGFLMGIGLMVVASKVG